MTRRRELFAAWAAGDLGAAVEIAARIPATKQPAWAASLVSWCAERAPRRPLEVDRLLEIAPDVTRWHEARGVFHVLRERKLAAQGDEDLTALLSVAELAAKVTFNASGGSAPFDRDSAARLAVALRRFVERLASHPDVEHEAWHLLTAPLPR